MGILNTVKYNQTQVNINKMKFKKTDKMGIFMRYCHLHRKRHVFGTTCSTAFHLQI